MCSATRCIFCICSCMHTYVWWKCGILCVFGIFIVGQSDSPLWGPLVSDIFFVRVQMCHRLYLTLTHTVALWCMGLGLSWGLVGASWLRFNQEPTVELLCFANWQMRTRFVLCVIFHFSLSKLAFRAKLLCQPIVQRDMVAPYHYVCFSSLSPFSSTCEELIQDKGS